MNKFKSSLHNITIFILIASSFGCSFFDDDKASKDGSVYAAIVPSAPGAATVIKGETRLTLRWDVVSGATAYEVWHNTVNNSSNAEQSSGDIPVQNYTITNLNAGTNYYIWLKAKNSAGTSGFGDVTATSTIASVATFADAAVPGDKIEVTVGTQKIIMTYANNSTNISFPTGTDDGSTAVLTKKFFLSKNEVTNSLIVEVLEWAYSSGKLSETPGVHNEVNSSTVKYGEKQLLDLAGSESRINYNGSGDFSAVVNYENMPVVHISWFGAVMICNWLTEMQDGSASNVVYDGIPVNGAWTDDNTPVFSERSGYRLPDNDEWEFAARYIDGSTWTYGDHVSGDESGACFDDGSILGGLGESTVFGNYAWYYDNSDTGSGRMLHNVKQKTANHLGLFDMSGNAWEWTVTENDVVHRITKGGGWDSASDLLRIGKSNNSSPDDTTPNIGFRLAKTQ